MDMPKTESQFRDLLSRVCDQGVTGDESQALCDLLATEPRLRCLYVEFMATEALLLDSLRDGDSDQTAMEGGILDLASVLSKPPSRQQHPNEIFIVHPVTPLKPRITRRLYAAIYDVASNYVVLSLLVSAIVMANILLSMGLIVPRQNRAVPMVDSPSTEFVADITGTHLAAWDEASDGNLRNPSLFAGEAVILTSGLAEVTFADGAVVLLEGPAEFVVGAMEKGERIEGKERTARSSSLRPSNSGYLAHGSLVARVEGKKAEGFTIETPSVRIEDLGTEFRVDVDRSGRSDVIVLEGAVELILDHAPAAMQRLLLVKNQRVSVAANGRETERREDVDAAAIARMRSRYSMFAMGGQGRAGVIFWEDFNSLEPPPSRGQNIRQADGTGLLFHAFRNIVGWAKTGDHAAHVLDLTGNGTNYAIMIFSGSSAASTEADVLTLTSGIAANDSGVTYDVSFLIGSTTGTDPGFETTLNDRVVFEVLRADDTVLHTYHSNPGAWGGGPEHPMSLDGFSYVGDGTGDVRIRIHSLLNDTADLVGTIDNITVSVAPVAEQSSK